MPIFKRGASFNGFKASNIAAGTTAGDAVEYNQIVAALAGKRSITRTVNTQTGTSYTFVIGDYGNVVDFSNTGTVTVTIPTNASVAFPVGTEIEGVNLNTGDVVFVGAGGVTINSPAGLAVRDQFGAYGLRKTATNTWVLYGRTVA